MSNEAVTRDTGFQLRGMTDTSGAEYGIYTLDIGEIYLKAPDGNFYKLSVEEISAEDVSFIDEDDWLTE